MFSNRQNAYNDSYNNFPPFYEEQQQRHNHYQPQYQSSNYNTHQHSNYTSYQPTYQNHHQPSYQTHHQPSHYPHHQHSYLPNHSPSYHNYNQYPQHTYNHGYQPTYQSRHNPYEEEFMRRQPQRMAEQQESYTNQRYQTNPSQNMFQNDRPKSRDIHSNTTFNQYDQSKLFTQKNETNSSAQKNPYEQMKFQNESPYKNNRQQQTNQQTYNNTQNTRTNNEVFKSATPKVIQIDVYTTIQEEKLDYQKELSNIPNKNNLDDGLIEERHSDEIDQKAQKLSEMCEKEYSYCLQIVLQNPDLSLGKYIDIIFNKESQRNKK